jgi:hypothetical protein
MEALKAELAKLAEKEHRTLSSMAEILLIRAIEVEKRKK